MRKIDYRKELGEFYKASATTPAFVDLPPLNYLMIDGHGDPNVVPAFAAAVETLYTVAYTIKFAVKRGPEAVDFGVMPLEGLWWADDMRNFTVDDKSQWHWTMMILQPPIVTGSHVASAIDAAREKKSPPLLDDLRFETFTEGPCGQVLHVGPFATEGPTIAGLHTFIGQRGQLAGKHHEIYLTDMRRADPKNWKTIIRQPLRPDA